MADTKKPYGSVTYADPKNGKYPIDSEAHIRAAWSYINMPKNASAYPLNGVTLGEVKAKIAAAMKRIGADVADDSKPASRAELFRSYPLEDAHIVTRGEGDGSGRLVEAYCAVFNEPAEIMDHEGHYEEEIDRVAFNKRIADVERSRAGYSLVKCIYNHGMTLHGTPAERFSTTPAVCRHISAESRGVLTRSYYLDTPLGNEVLEMWREGAINAQSFTGAIIRSTPELRRGERYRPRGGQLTRVRRMELGLKEFGATPFPAYTGAELVGVRMSPLGTWQAADDEEQVDDAALPSDGEAASGEPLARTEGEEHSARYHQHSLYALRSREIREKAGLVWLPDRKERAADAHAEGKVRRDGPDQGRAAADGRFRGHHRGKRRRPPGHPRGAVAAARHRVQADHRADGARPRDHPRRRRPREPGNPRGHPLQRREPGPGDQEQPGPLRRAGRGPLPRGPHLRAARAGVRRDRARGQARQPGPRLRGERDPDGAGQPGQLRPRRRRAHAAHRVRGVPGGLPRLRGGPAGHGPACRAVPDPRERRLPAAVRAGPDDHPDQHGQREPVAADQQRQADHLQHVERRDVGGRQRGVAD